MSGDQGQVPTVTELVQRAVDTGVTLRQLEDRSGGAVPYQTFSYFKRGRSKSWPHSPRTVEGIARALGVDNREVVLSFAAQMGVDLTEDRPRLVAMLPASTGQLTEDQAALIVALIRALTDDRSTRATPP